MTTPILRVSLAALACAATLALATPSMAAMMTFKANLAAASEVPPNASAGKGEVTATYDDATKKLTWNGDL